MKGVVKQLYCVLCMYLLREKKYLVGIQNKYSWHFLDLICTKEHNTLSYHTTKSLYRDTSEFVVSFYVWIHKSKVSQQNFTLSKVAKKLLYWEEIGLLERFLSMYLIGKGISDLKTW